MKSDRILGVSVLLQIALLSGCSQKPADEAASSAVPVEETKMEPLTDPELMGLDRDKIVLTMPWSAGPVSHDPDSTSLKAGLTSVALSAGDGFDRAQFEFVEYFNLPGYRVAWNDTTAASCRDPKAPSASHLLFVEFEPATAKDRKGGATITPSGAGLTAIDRARQQCDDNSYVVWTVEADSAQVRVVEMRNPPRLLVDIKHGGTAKSAAPSPAVR
jgi:hypothetical protein